MKIERIKKCIEWDRLEFEVFRPVYLENKYLKIDKDSKTIFIKDGIFAYEKECCIESKELHTIVSDIDKMNIRKWKDMIVYGFPEWIMLLLQLKQKLSKD